MKENLENPEYLVTRTPRVATLFTQLEVAYSCFFYSKAHIP